MSDKNACFYYHIHDSTGHYIFSNFEHLVLHVTLLTLLGLQS